MAKNTLESEMLTRNIRLMSSEDEEERLNAVEALVTSTWDPAWSPKMLIDGGGLPAVASCLSAGSPRVRGAAVALLRALVERGEAEAVAVNNVVPVLERLRDDPDEIVKTRAALLLELLRSKGCF
ncbi:HEAT repeat protein [Methanolinea mesophila]|uniref:HEAT repeat domain-containing protein n=1 Tax=Methanolinea mesophila TaxID=547055 RepID=UPI001AE15033|nr:HEAT repeat domain-containing protein [Methanolinea mesophila]MBP1928852.1 HEAT repeat protein [Methanolinea mesophila]